MDVDLFWSVWGGQGTKPSLLILIKIGHFFSPCINNAIVCKYANIFILKSFGLKVLMDKTANPLGNKLVLLTVTC